MDTLIAVGTLAAYGFSVAQLLTGGMELYFETAILLIAFLTLGRYLEARARAAPARPSGPCWSWAPSRPGCSATASRCWSRSSRSPSATCCGSPGRRSRSTARCGRGQRGRRVDADRRERPGRQGAGDRVAGATVNTSGVLTVRATAVGADTALAQIVRLVEQAQAGKGELQRLADRISAVFVPLVMAVAVLTSPAGRCSAATP